MSNGLSSLLIAAGVDQPATGPAHHQTDAMMRPILTLCAIGICVLAVWIIRRLASPHKLSLARTPGRPNGLTPAHIIVVLLIWLSLLALLTALPDREDPWLRIPALMAAQTIWLAVALIVARLTFRHGLGRGLGLSMRHWLCDTGRGVLGYLAVLPVCMALFWAIPRCDSEMHPVLLELPSLPTVLKVLTVVSVVVLAPLAEEVFFRGLLQSILRKYTRSAWIAIVVASGLFALVHVPQWKDMPALFALAIALGYNYERTGRLGPAILMHAIFNAVNISLRLGSA